MYAFARLPPSLLARARADQVAALYARWHLTTSSMALGALLLCAVMWGHVEPAVMIGWLALIAINQGWRGMLARAWRRARPGTAAATRWGRYFAIGSTAAGALWGVAGIAMFPASLQHQALIIVCLFGVVVGGLYLTAVYKPSFYGFALCALLPLIVRVAAEGDAVHLFTAAVLSVVLAFLLGFGHRVNDVLTHSLAMRYQNVDLIGELRDRSRAAVEARQAAEAANRAKSQLLAAASHDLRQPLHALGLYVAALSLRVRGARQRALVDNVQSAVAALEMQFDQLIDLSRLESGTFDVECQALPLGPLLERLEAEFAAQASARGLHLAIAPTRVIAHSDEKLLERMLRNLISNAIRYTAVGGVLVGVRRRGARVSIDVVDTGIGIAAEHQQRVFEEFYQVRENGQQDRTRRGLGLGLALVRRFAGLLDHRIELASRPGRGSRFSIVVPRASQPPLPRRVTATQALPTLRAEQRLADQKIAVIDDDEAVLDAMRVLLTAWGADVVCAHDAAAMLEACIGHGRAPTLVIADLRLADAACGIDAVAQVRDAFAQMIPAVVVSGDTGADAQRRAQEAGLVLLRKPLDSNALREAACAALRSGGVLPSR
ncbi:MAG TPA: ATP-binding protein [Casimicrobiaceae bacterium]|nr:ATP-binding protein [Casimicrobiaceae bacterium]